MDGHEIQDKQVEQEKNVIREKKVVFKVFVLINFPPSLLDA